MQSSLPTECDADYYQTSGGACRSCPTNSNRALNQNATFCTCGDNRVTSSGSSTTTVAPCDGELILVCFCVDMVFQALPCVLMDSKEEGISLIPRPSHCKVFDRLQLAERKEEALVHFIL